MLLAKRPVAYAKRIKFMNMSINLFKNYSKLLVYQILFLVFSVNYAFAQSATQPGQGITPVKLENPLKFTSLNDFLVAIINVVMVLMIPVIVFFIIYAGFKYVTARGNASQIEEATKTLTYAIIGAILILGAIVISQVIKGTVDSFIAA